MHIAKGSARTALHLQSLPPEVRQYVAELEYELGRTQRRNCLLRKNIRSMQSKLQIANLQERLLCYQREAPALRAVL